MIQSQPPNSSLISFLPGWIYRIAEWVAALSNEAMFIFRSNFTFGFLPMVQFPPFGLTLLNPDLKSTFSDPFFRVIRHVPAPTMARC